MDNQEQEKSKSFQVSKIVAYTHHAITMKCIIKKITGHVNVMAFDKDESLMEKISRFDTLVQIIDGNAEITIDGNLNLLQTGQAIIVPANSTNVFKATERFKMISTVIKSGYETD